MEPQISFAEAIEQIWRRIFGSDRPMPALPATNDVSPEQTVASANPHLRAIAETIAWGLHVPPAIAAVYETGDGKFTSVRQEYWEQPNAVASALAGKIFTRNLGADFWNGLRVKLDWEPMDCRPAFIRKTGWVDWCDEVFGRDISSWIPAPAAFRLAGILSGEGKDKARTKMLYMFRDGVITPRGQVNTPKGPEHVPLGTSWWINLEYREGANAVWRRDNILYAHTDHEGRSIPARAPGQLPTGVRASPVEVKRDDVRAQFEKAFADSIEGGVSKTVKGPRRTNRASIEAKAKMRTKIESVLAAARASKYSASAKDQARALARHLEGLKPPLGYDEETIRKILLGTYPAQQRLGIAGYYK